MTIPPNRPIVKPDAKSPYAKYGKKPYIYSWQKKARDPEPETPRKKGR